MQLLTCRRQTVCSHTGHRCRASCRYWQLQLQWQPAPWVPVWSGGWPAPAWWQRWATSQPWSCSVLGFQRSLGPLATPAWGLRCYLIPVGMVGHSSTAIPDRNRVSKLKRQHIHVFSSRFKSKHFKFYHIISQCNTTSYLYMLYWLL